MLRAYRVLILFVLLAIPVGAANVPSFVRTELGNCTAAPPAAAATCKNFTWQGGRAYVEVYGVFDGATASMKYSSDAGASFVDVELPSLVAITSAVRLKDITLGEGWTIQLEITGGGGLESITWSVARID